MSNNCPNCGAPISSPVCEYCGTRHEDPALLSMYYALGKELAYAQAQMSQAAQTQYLLSCMKSWTAWSPT